MNLIKWVLLSLSLLIICVLFLWAVVMPAVFVGGFDKKVTAQEAMDNFNDHEAEIIAFSDLLIAKKPGDHEMSIALNGNKCSISVGLPGWAVHPKHPNQHYEFKVPRIKDHQELLKKLNWDIPTFNSVIEAFGKTNCEYASTSDGDVRLSYRHGTWTSFGYYVKSIPIGDSLKAVYQANGVRMLNDRVTLSSASAL